MSNKGADETYYSINDVREKLREVTTEEKKCYISSYATGLLKRRGAYTDLTLVNGTEVTSLSVNRSRVLASFMDDFRFIPEKELQKAFKEIGLDLTAPQQQEGSENRVIELGSPKKAPREKPSRDPNTLLSLKAALTLTRRIENATVYFIKEPKNTRAVSRGLFKIAIGNVNLPPHKHVVVSAPMNGKPNHPFLSYGKLMEGWRQAGLAPA